MQGCGERDGRCDMREVGRGKVVRRKGRQGWREGGREREREESTMRGG